MSINRRTSSVLILLVAAALVAIPAAARNRPASSASASFPEIVAQLDAFAQAAMAEEKIPGMAYAVIKDDQVVFSKGSGVKSAGLLSSPVTEDTVFEVGSTTKAFTASLIAMLVEQGKLSWDTPVVSVIPSFWMYDEWVRKEMRVVDLLCQRSGMPPYSLDMMGMIGWGPRDIVNALENVKPVTSFRSTFGYVNSLWIVAAAVIEQRGGLTWEEAINVNIFGPLGMQETTVDPEIVSILGDIAVGHQVVAGVPTPIPSNWQYRDWVDVMGPAGSIRSTVHDMSRWARLHLNRGKLDNVQLLKPETVDFLHSGRTYIGSMNGGQSSYALAWVREEHPQATIVWHNGGTAGQHSIVALYPAANVGLVVLTNTPTNKVPERMKDKLFQLMYPSTTTTGLSAATVPAEFSSERPPRVEAAARPLAPVPSLPLSRYTGDYLNPAYGIFTVQEKNGGLVMLMGPRKVEATLTHYSGNSFTVAWPDMPGQTSILTFRVVPGAPPWGFTDPEFGDVEDGWFGRRPTP